MMRRLLDLKRNERGMSVVEFALIVPAFVTFIVAIANIGILFFAHSGLKSAVAEGARYANIYPRPTNAQILARITDRQFGMNSADITNPTVADCTSGGRACLDIQMSYLVRMDFVFFSWPTFNITERRRVFVYDASLSQPTPATPTSTPTTPAPSDPTDPTPTDPTPTDPTPTDPTPTDPTPTDPTPTDPEPCTHPKGKCK